MERASRLRNRKKNSSVLRRLLCQRDALTHNLKTALRKLIMLPERPASDGFRTAYPNSFKRARDLARSRAHALLKVQRTHPPKNFTSLCTQNLTPLRPFAPSPHDASCPEALRLEVEVKVLKVQDLDLGSPGLGLHVFETLGL